jgi:hypothetical protein
MRRRGGGGALAGCVIGLKTTIPFQLRPYFDRGATLLQGNPKLKPDQSFGLIALHLPP